MQYVDMYSYSISNICDYTALKNSPVTVQWWVLSLTEPAVSPIRVVRITTCISLLSSNWSMIPESSIRWIKSSNVCDFFLLLHPLITQNIHSSTESPSKADTNYNVLNYHCTCSISTSSSECCLLRSRSATIVPSFLPCHLKSAK